MTLPSPPPRRFDGEPGRKAGDRIARMFDRIAPTYDLLNHLLSANIDRTWRKKAVSLLDLQGTERALDVCTGTGDLAIALLDAGAAEVVGCDFSTQMIRLATEKAGERIHFQVADALALPFEDGSFDVATVAFGVRNFHDLDQGLGELGRVLRAGGRLVILEFSRPPNRLIRGVYETYAMLLLPLVGNLVSGGADNAYAYLPRSVQAFPGAEAFTARIRDAGFSSVAVHRLTGGIAAIHVATR